MAVPRIHATMASNNALNIQSCTVQDDDVFGPVVVSSCRGGFDFTLLFEQAILSCGPSALFLLIVPLRIIWLYGRPIVTSQRHRALLKKTVSADHCHYCLKSLAYS
jgi:ATP-binding cassette subfamily C (CFTR/MRP) protein 1